MPEISGARIIIEVHADLADARAAADASTAHDASSPDGAVQVVGCALAPASATVVNVKDQGALGDGTTDDTRQIENHYPTMTLADICALPVAALAHDDAVLFLWATAPMLPHALAVMSAWGFDYRSHAIWQKDRIGTGYWFRNAHELLLVGTCATK